MHSTIGILQNPAPFLCLGSILTALCHALPVIGYFDIAPRWVYIITKSPSGFHNIIEKPQLCINKNKLLVICTRKYYFSRIGVRSNIVFSGTPILKAPSYVSLQCLLFFPASHSFYFNGSACVMAFPADCKLHEGKHHVSIPSAYHGAC